MTDRSKRGSQGRGRQRPAKGTTGPKRTEEAKPTTGSRPDSAPHSKRFGRRPPKAVRSGGTTERPEGTGEEQQRARRNAGAHGAGKRPWTSKSGGRAAHDKFRRKSKPAPKQEDDGRIRLNRYLSMSGVASRRDADDLIKAGVVTVNGQVVTELGTKVGPNDKVHYGGQRLSREAKRYVLLNKPKDFITTTDDPRDRRTVMALVDDACTERIYPVGRLDRNTTGLLLLTNDGDLAKRLTHPSHGAEKIYHVTLDKNVTRADLEQLVKGVPLDDGPAQADEARYVDGASKREIGLKLHMGRNRVVRRMFEAMGYEVVKLDRVVFAGLTKKNLERGRWRHLTEQEVLFLTKRKMPAKG